MPRSTVLLSEPASSSDVRRAMPAFLRPAVDIADANGYVIYDGPARWSGERIVVIATGYDRPSANSKTGPMIQTWILHAGMNPVAAVKSGADSVICGAGEHACSFRPAVARELGADAIGTCYVNHGQGPASVWAAWQRGRYPGLAPRTAGERSRLAGTTGRPIRLGAYGDPGMVPVAVWRELLAGSGGARTGYTHQWRRAPWLRTVCMASVDSAEERTAARELGWRTFRVVHSVEELGAGEISCPASEEAGHRTRCSDCRLCDGRRASSDRRADIAIIDHGPTSELRARLRRESKEGTS
jgi:hypothetical protein